MPLVMPEVQIWCFIQASLWFPVAEYLSAMNAFHHKLVMVCTSWVKMIVIFCLVSPNLIFQFLSYINTTKSKCGDLLQNIWWFIFLIIISIFDLHPLLRNFFSDFHRLIFLHMKLCICFHTTLPIKKTSYEAPYFLSIK